MCYGPSKTQDGGSAGGLGLLAANASIDVHVSGVEARLPVIVIGVVVLVGLEILGGDVARRSRAIVVLPPLTAR